MSVSGPLNFFNEKVLMAIDYSSLVVGYVFSRRRYSVPRDTVNRYLEAVQDSSSRSSEDSPSTNYLAPPMCVAALSLKGVVQDLQIPGGTLHISQDMRFTKPVPIDMSLTCTATLQQNSTRGDWRVIMVEMEVTDTMKDIVLKSRSSIMIPMTLP